jgi:hypothetical protein
MQIAQRQQRQQGGLIMEKQQKILNKIASCQAYGNEGQLGKKNNDECYTSMQTILDELTQWAALGKFQGKRIICPCDWDISEGDDIYSITIEYEPDFKVSGNSVYEGVKVEIGLFDFLDDEKKTILKKIELKEDEVEEFLRDKLTCNFIRTFTQNARVWGIKSITASGYNPEVGKGIPFQDVDYSKYDICVTNPPFSLYKEFMNCLLGKIDFIILAPFLNRKATWQGIPMQEGKAYLGFGVHLDAEFQNPTKDNKFNVKHVNCDWLTSFPEAQDARNSCHFRTGVHYEDYKDEWPEMPNMTMKDGTHPIRVSMSTYPEDFDGWMFATIGVLDNLDQSKYEWYNTNFSKYYNDDLSKSPFAGEINSATIHLRSDGKNNFCGIVFRKKKGK